MDISESVSRALLPDHQVIGEATWKTGVLAGYGEVVRTKRSDGWQQLRQVVYVDREQMTGVTVRVALCGRGQAFFDDLLVRKLVE